MFGIWPKMQVCFLATTTVVAKSVQKSIQWKTQFIYNSTFTMYTWKGTLDSEDYILTLQSKIGKPKAQLWTHALQFFVVCNFLFFLIFIENRSSFYKIYSNYHFPYLYYSHLLPIIRIYSLGDILENKQYSF